MKKRLTVLLFIFAMFAAGLRAEVVMPKIFGNNMVVERGLVPGEMVVTEGINKLSPGVKVTIARPEDFVKPEGEDDKDSE